ncbi:MAG: cation transporter [Gemmatimonadaceae bacterium]
MIAAWRARSIALAGFGLDSLIEIFASLIVVWQLKDYDMNSIANPMPRARERRALQLIGGAFLALGVYVAVEIAVVLVMQYRAAASPRGIAWLLATVIAMMVLAAEKHRTGTALGNTVLVHEARVTTVDAYLAASVLAGLALNAVFGWWWADPLSALLIVYYAIHEWRELRTQLLEARTSTTAVST